MADNEIKIKVVVDDSQEKKYYSESESRRKKSSASETQEEIRKTAVLKEQLNERYAKLKQALALELEAEKQGNRLEIKEAIAKRKILEADLRNFNATHRTVLAERLSTTRATLEKEVALYKAQIKQISSAPRTNLRGNIGSEAYVRQLQSARTTMLPTSPEFAQTTALINRYKDTLKQSGVEVKSLAQNIRGELTSALSTSAGAFIGVTGAMKLFNMSLESAKFSVLKENFQGTEEDLENFRLATARTVDDASLIKLSNQASDLGVGLEQQAILFSLAEDAADKYGTSIEEGFQKVVFATEGNTKGLKMLGIQKAEYEETVKRLALAHGKEIEQLDSETQKEIRLQAILQLSGKTIDDVKNKVQDSADKHEQFIVIVKNLSLVYGGDLFNAVTGVGTAYRVVTEAVSKLSTVTEIQKNIILSSVSAWEGLLGKIPVVGDAISWLADRYRDLAGAQSQGADMIDAPDAGEDFVKAFDPNYKEGVTRKGGKGFTPSGSKNSGSKVETQKEILNLIELEQQKLAKLNTQLNANLGDIGSELQLRREILAVELEIFRLRTGQRIDLGNALNGLNSMALTNAEPLRRIIGINSRAGNDPRSDMTSDEIQAMELSFEDMKGITDGILGGFQQMLQLTGLMETDFGKMIQWLQSVINTGSSFFDIFSTIAGFIPGGSIVSGAIGAIGGGGINPMAGGMPRSGGMSFNPTVIVNSEVEKTKSIKFYQNTMPEFNRRQALKSL